MRLQAGGRIDRARPLSFSFNGRRLQGFEGDTLASALLANDVRVVARSITHGRPRGIFSAGIEEPNALVQVGAEPMLRATQVELREGLEAASLNGRGRALLADDAVRFDKRYAHCELLVVGGGGHGLRAALDAGRRGDRVILVDEQSEMGGQQLSERLSTSIGASLSELSLMPEVQLLTPDHRLGPLRPEPRAGGGAAPRRAAALAGSGQARGARHRGPRAPAGVRQQRPPGDHACRRRSHLPEPLRGCSRPACRRLHQQRQHPTGWWPNCAPRVSRSPAVIDARAGNLVTDTQGDENGITGITVEGQRIECDLLCVSGGFNPAVHLFSQVGGRLRYDERLACFVPGEGPSADRGRRPGSRGSRDSPSVRPG